MRVRTGCVERRATDRLALLDAQVHHVGLAVGELQRSVDFYCGNFGLREIARSQLEGEQISAQTGLPDTLLDVALLAGSNTIVELLCYRRPVGAPYTLRTCDAGAAHVCVVVDDLDATYEAMRARGVHFHAAPTKLVGDTKMVYVRDPDGVIVELIEPEGTLTLEALLRLRGAAGD